MTCFLKDNCSHLHLFMCLEVFSNNSGLKVYNVKTELLAVGRQCLEHTEFTHTVWLTIKIFGVYFDYHNPSGMKANFDSIFKSLKKKSTLNMWRCRGLTLLGKFQFLPKFMSKGALITTSKDLIKELHSLMYGFIWRGNNKIKMLSNIL